MEGSLEKNKDIISIIVFDKEMNIIPFTLELRTMLLATSIWNGIDIPESKENILRMIVNHAPLINQNLLADYFAKIVTDYKLNCVCGISSFVNTGDAVLQLKNYYACVAGFKTNLQVYNNIEKPELLNYVEIANKLTIFDTEDDHYIGKDGLDKEADGDYSHVYKWLYGDPIILQKFESIVYGVKEALDVD